MMRYSFTQRFLRQLDSFPVPVRKKFNKQFLFLLDNLKYPSLRAKKYDESKGVWQMRVDKSVRCYFAIRSDEYIFWTFVSTPTKFGSRTPK